MGDDGFGLACPHCDHIFPTAITVGVMAAHMEVEHGNSADKIQLELVVLCPRCRKAMDLVRSETTGTGERHHYDCKPCRRSRVVNQNQPGGRDE